MQSDLFKVANVARQGDFRIGAAIEVVEQETGQAALGQAPEIFNRSRGKRKRWHVSRIVPGIALHLEYHAESSRIITTGKQKTNQREVLLTNIPDPDIQFGMKSE